MEENVCCVFCSFLKVRACFSVHSRRRIGSLLISSGSFARCRNAENCGVLYIALSSERLASLGDGLKYEMKRLTKRWSDVMVREAWWEVLYRPEVLKKKPSICDGRSVPLGGYLVGSEFRS